MVMNLKTLFVKYIKLRIKLSKAKIYKIIDNTNNNVYIGSTCRTLKRRLSGHKSDYKRFLKGDFSNVKSFDIIKNNDYKIELLENCNIKTKQELLQREKYFIKNNDCLNKVVPGRSRREYKDDNKDKIKVSAKNYYIANQDKLKIYRNDNKDKRKDYNKQYRIDNKDKINIKRNEKHNCLCGSKYTIQHKARHFKTTKHQEFVKSNN